MTSLATWAPCWARSSILSTNSWNTGKYSDVEVLLIEEVRKYPVLWNTSNPNYKNRTKKENTCRMTRGHFHAFLSLACGILQVENGVELYPLSNTFFCIFAFSFASGGGKKEGANACSLLSATDFTQQWKLFMCVFFRRVNFTRQWKSTFTPSYMTKIAK